jgi:hypothetical protein
MSGWLLDFFIGGVIALFMIPLIKPMFRLVFRILFGFWWDDKL